MTLKVWIADLGQKILDRGEHSEHWPMAWKAALATGDLHVMWHAIPSRLRDAIREVRQDQITAEQNYLSSLSPDQMAALDKALGISE